jgi:DNA-binding NarL/FixJ family response regulator
MILPAPFMKVMIVDDSILLQNRLMKSLHQADREMMICQAYNCNEAIELFSSFRPETIILDIELPDGSGINLLRRFKEGRPDVKVIVFTNYSTDVFKKSCMDLSASDFIKKPDYLGLLNALISLKFKTIQAI